MAGKGYRIALVEKEKELFKKASIVNQARLHGGYHYPRSVATARMSDDHKKRFTEEHKDFINFSFEKYYAIDKYSSLTDAAQFERFCQFIDIKCERIFDHPLFNYERLEAVYLTTEYSFDPILMGEFYKDKIIAEKNIEVFYFHKINNVEKSNAAWEINLESLNENNFLKIKTNAVINATYSGSNAVNRQFGVADIQLMHEIAEIAFVTSPQFNNMGLTVMDGQFGSVMPYGKSGLLSLSSVAYTHHKVSYNNLPTFDCQEINKKCTPEFSSICNFLRSQTTLQLSKNDRPNATLLFRSGTIKLSNFLFYH